MEGIKSAKSEKFIESHPDLGSLDEFHELNIPRFPRNLSQKQQHCKKRTAKNSHIAKTRTAKNSNIAKTRTAKNSNITRNKEKHFKHRWGIG